MQHDIQKDAVGIREEYHHLLDHRTEMIEVSAVEAEFVKSRFKERTGSPRRNAGRVDFAPLRMGLGTEFVAPGGEVDGNADSHLVRRIELGAKEIEGERRMHCSDLRRVIAVAVVAERKTGGRFDRRLL